MTLIPSLLVGDGGKEKKEVEKGHQGQDLDEFLGKIRREGRVENVVVILQSDFWVLISQFFVTFLVHTFRVDTEFVSYLIGWVGKKGLWSQVASLPFNSMRNL